MSQILLSCNYNTSKRQVEYLVFDKDTAKITVVSNTDLVDNKSDYDKVTKLVDGQNKENKLALVFLSKIGDMLAFADHVGNIYILKNGEALAIEGSGIRLINCKIYDKTGTIGCISSDRILQTDSLAGKVKFTVLLALGLENGLSLAKAGFKNLVYNKENVAKSVRYLKFILSSNHQSSIIRDYMKYITTMLYNVDNLSPLYMLRNGDIGFLVWSYNYELGFDMTLKDADAYGIFKDISTLRIEMPYDEEVVSGKASDLLLNGNKGEITCRVNVDWKTFNVKENQMIYEFYCNGADILKNGTGAKITIIIDKNGKFYFDIASYNSELQNGHFRGFKRLYEFGYSCTNLNLEFLSVYGDAVHMYMTDNNGVLLTSIRKSAEARYKMYKTLLNAGSQITRNQDCIKLKMDTTDFSIGIKSISGTWFSANRRLSRVAKTQIIKLGDYDFAVASISDKNVPAFLTCNNNGMAANLVKYEVYKDGILVNTFFGYDLYTILCSFTFAGVSGISNTYSKYSLADFKYALKEKESCLQYGWVTPVDVWNLSKAFVHINPENLLDYRKSVREIVWQLVEDPLTGLIWFVVSFSESAGYGDGASYIKMTNVSDLDLIDRKDNEFVRKIFAFKDVDKAIYFFKAMTESADSPLRDSYIASLVNKIIQAYQSSRGVSSGILYERALDEVEHLMYDSMESIILHRIAGKNVEDQLRGKLSEFGIIGG